MRALSLASLCIAALLTVAAAPPAETAATGVAVINATGIPNTIDQRVDLLLRHTPTTQPGPLLCRGQVGRHQREQLFRRYRRAVAHIPERQKQQQPILQCVEALDQKSSKVHGRCCLHLAAEAWVSQCLRGNAVK